MTDFMLGTTWLAVLGAALAGALVLRTLGVAATYVRDALHIGAGIWVLGWPLWHGIAIPIAIVVATAIVIALVPTLARHVRIADRVERAVTGGDEQWGGLILYTIAYAIFTAIGLVADPFPAAAGLLALSLGDGIGGAVGRALGDHHYRAPGAKQKSIEGSIVVMLGATAGALIAAQLFGAPLHLGGAVIIGLVAALAEAFSPSGTDNLVLPIAVFIAATLV